MNKFAVILNEQTPAVPAIDINVQAWIMKNVDIIESFLNYTTSREDAAGLAANQCSLNGERFMARMFATRGNEQGEWEIIINPKIIKTASETISKIEGCLTWPKNKVVADRYDEITVQYNDSLTGEVLTRTISGFESQVWQHEQAHLDGIEEELLYKTKIPRNSPCPCGSKKKYKQCCLRNK